MEAWRWWNSATRFAVGDEVEIILPQGEGFRQKITSIIDQGGAHVQPRPIPNRLFGCPWDSQCPLLNIEENLGSVAGNNDQYFLTRGPDVTRYTGRFKDILY